MVTLNPKPLKEPVKEPPKESLWIRKGTLQGTLWRYSEAVPKPWTLNALNPYNPKPPKTLKTLKNLNPKNPKKPKKSLQKP